MAELVPTMMVGPLLSIVKDKASSYLLDQYKVMEGMEEQHRILTRKLPAILDVITDAEQAASHREGAKAWLLEVKRVAYEANEIFDEFKYEALRREAKKNGHYSKLSFDVVKLFPPHNRFAFRDKMGKKLCRVVKAIEVLVTEMNAFGFKYQRQLPASNHLRQTDHVIFDPEKIISRSRDQDTKNIVETLVGQASNADLTVVPIVGIGGLGKTTLAQLIYNEPKIQKHFKLLIWVCASDSFDPDSLAKKIAEFHHRESTVEDELHSSTVKASSKKGPFDISQDEFHRRKGTVEAASKKGPLENLQDVLSGHRYLLVLDDVWNREPDRWKKLKARLTHGAKGSVVLTTTRDKGVAKIMGTTEAYNLGALEDSFIEEIIETRAFSLQKEEERPAVLVKMVGEIVKRCCGSPLAATALGSVLCTKNSEEEWKDISSRSNICTEESGILPILKLSYNDLSSQMKQCFAFCAVFPKDYEIDVFKLIQLWIAHGFIQDRKEVSPETIGQRIFSELASRSFFIDKKCRRYDCYKHTCKIHDLMHDIALSVMENECALALEEPSQIEWLPDTTRHILLSCEEPQTILNYSLAKRSPAIRTLLCDTDMQDPLQHLSKYSSLKALRLPIRSRSFPLKSKYLHHLRYLDVSGSDIEALPEDISILYNLQTLNVSDCSELCRLPRQMKYMTALRHLYTHDCPSMTSMPGDLRKLVSLQTLTCFVAGTDSEFSDVGELQWLNLGGKLELRQLENVTEEDAIAANIGKKKELRKLTLIWTVGSEKDPSVLEGLKPHDQLQAVWIESYGGYTFPTWMAMSRNLVVIHLSDCTKLQWLFSCDACFTFPNLKEFTLHGLEHLDRWWESSNEEQGKKIIFPQLLKLSILCCKKLTALPEATLLRESYGAMARSAFPELKELILKNLQSFERWEANEATERGHIVFPRLKKLTIENCPALTALPEVPSGGDYSMTPTGGVWPRLKTGPMGLMCSKFSILYQRMGRRGAPPMMTPSAFPALKFLRLKDLRSFERWDAVEGSRGEEMMFPQLEKLYVRGCERMTALSGQQRVCPKLTVLDIEGSEGDMFLWVARHMTSLTKLKLMTRRDMEITSAVADDSLKQVVDVIGRWNHPDFPLASMKLIGLRSGVTELFPCFVQLGRLCIRNCASLVHWPEIEFKSLVSLRRLEIGRCQQLVGYAEAPAAQPSTTSESSIQLLPHLQFLHIHNCERMVEVFKLPTSLKKLAICNCIGLESIFNRRLHQGQSPSSAVSREEQFHFACLECIAINECTVLREIFDLPPSVKHIRIIGCGELTSVNFHTGQMPSLERLYIKRCRSLSSLPDGPQAYSSLECIKIKNCSGIKRLPTCLEERLSSIQCKHLDARHQEPSLLKPKTWRNANCRE